MNDRHLTPTSLSDYEGDLWEEIGVIGAEMHELSDSEVSYCTRFLEPVMLQRLEYLLQKLKQGPPDVKFTSAEAEDVDDRGNIILEPVPDVTKEV